MKVGEKRMWFQMRAAAAASRSRASEPVRVRFEAIRLSRRQRDSVPAAKAALVGGHANLAPPAPAVPDESLRSAPAACLPAAEAQPLESLCRCLLQAASQVAQKGAALELAFSTGPWQGVVCRLELKEGSVGCRLRAPGAFSRRLLGRLRPLLSQRLLRNGMALGSFEVGT